MFFNKEELKKRGLIWNGRHLPYNPNNVEKARQLRKNMTPEEKKLWYQFLSKVKPRFLRQKPIDNYIIDFYCSECRLAVEIDGSQHRTESGSKYDKNRIDILSCYGVKEIRFLNKEINEQFEDVKKRILKEIGL